MEHDKEHDSLMWIVRLALDRPYTFVVLALLVFIFAPVVILNTAVDIFPSIDIPVIAVAWSYGGLNPVEMEGRVTTMYERSLTTTVDNIEHTESTTISGRSMIKIFLQPGTNIDTAMAQVTAQAQSAVRQMPQGMQPPMVLSYQASSVPVLQLSISGEGLSEQQLADLSGNFLRIQLVSVPGISMPGPYGGKQRSVVIAMNPELLQSKGLAPLDVVTALGNQIPVLPTGTAKIGKFEYDVDTNGNPADLDAIGAVPLKVSGSSVVYLRDVATVSDGNSPQMNVARHDGRRGILISVLKNGDASTLDVVAGVRKILPRALATLPPALRILPIADQAVFVRSAVMGVVREAVLATILTGLMILVFLGSWRSTIIIAVSIPLSILTSVICLSMMHQTINLMTLGGLALAVGILVDHATVTIENVVRHLDAGEKLVPSILEGARQISTPVLVATLCICIVFFPMFFLTGVTKYLFVPLAEAVVFAMLASYFWSRTLVPTMAKYMLKEKRQGEEKKRRFDVWFESVREQYRNLLDTVVHHRKLAIPVVLLVSLSAFLLVPWLGQDFFPEIDSGQFQFHVRARPGTRVEETARVCDEVEKVIRREIPAGELDSIADNIGMPFSPVNLLHSNSGTVGVNDADILVSLRTKHHATADYIRTLRQKLNDEFPSVDFYTIPADMTSQVLNFGLPAPIDVQIEGSDLDGTREVANRLMAQLQHVPGLTDLHIQQPFGYPKLHVDVDRTRAAQAGYTMRDVASSMLNSLSGSMTVTPLFYLNPTNGVQYGLVTMTPQYRIQGLQDIQNIPIDSAAAKRPAILANVATISRSSEIQAVSHFNVRRVLDIYGSVQDRDLGAVGRDVQSIVDRNTAQLPRGTFLSVRGQLSAMQDSYRGLLIGLIFSVILVYAIIVVNFQSWLDPFIIVTALPAALAGIILILFMTHTRLSVPALMGSIMCMGVATANSILVVSFAKDRLQDHGDPVRAAIEAGFTRFRPVLMTAIAMIIGMIPMALNLGEGGEENSPLGRAVIGGLIFATISTLIFVPAVFAALHSVLGSSSSRGTSQELVPDSE
jgi:CzcA family heavy metal efflux pump